MNAFSKEQIKDQDNQIQQNQQNQVRDNSAYLLIKETLIKYDLEQVKGDSVRFVKLEKDSLAKEEMKISDELNKNYQLDKSVDNLMNRLMDNSHKIKISELPKTGEIYFISQEQRKEIEEISEEPAKIGQYLKLHQVKVFEYTNHDELKQILIAHKNDKLNEEKVEEVKENEVKVQETIKVVIASEIEKIKQQLTENAQEHRINDIKPKQSEVEPPPKNIIDNEMNFNSQLNQDYISDKFHDKHEAVMGEIHFENSYYMHQEITSNSQVYNDEIKQKGSQITVTSNINNTQDVNNKNSNESQLTLNASYNEKNKKTRQEIAKIEKTKELEKRDVLKEEGKKDLNGLVANCYKNGLALSNSNKIGYNQDIKDNFRNELEKNKFLDYFNSLPLSERRNIKEKGKEMAIDQGIKINSDKNQTIELQNKFKQFNKSSNFDREI